MVWRNHAAPVKRAHIPKSKASAHRYCLRGTNRHFHPAIGQRIPDAVKNFIADDQLHIGKVAIEIFDQLSGALRFCDTVNGNA